jgi:hypothetical protein
MIHVGIDYSMSCPALCIEKGGAFVFHFLAPAKKYEGTWKDGTIIGHIKPDFLSQEQRFDNISNWALSCIENACGHEKGLNEPMKVVIEGYAMGAKGKVFHIAENAGLLKHKLWKHRIDFDSPAPTTVKKFATGRGNANKEAMYDAYVADTGEDLEKLLDCKRDKNPVNDIVDAYWMCKYGMENHIEG